MIAETVRPEASPADRMEAMLTGHFVAQCLQAVVVLGIADSLAEGPRTIAAITEATGCHQMSLRRLMRTLASVGVFAEPAPGTYELTPLGATLRSDAGFLRDKAMWIISPQLWSAWGALTDTLRSGKPSFPAVHGLPLFQYLAEHVEPRAMFSRFMTEQSATQNAAVVEAYDFAGIRTLVDVGGGQGATLTAVLRHYPAMKGILFDLPEVATTARFEGADLGGRCQAVGGDMHKAVPAGADAYLIQRVMMDYADDRAITLLRNCVAAMDPAGRILVVDPTVPDVPEPHQNFLTDMQMLILTGGRCRTETEFRGLFGAAGLTVTRIVPTRSPNIVIEGRLTAKSHGW